MPLPTYLLDVPSKMHHVRQSLLLPGLILSLPPVLLLLAPGPLFLISGRANERISVEGWNPDSGLKLVFFTNELSFLPIGQGAFRGTLWHKMGKVEFTEWVDELLYE